MSNLDQALPLVPEAMLASSELGLRYAQPWEREP